MEASEKPIKIWKRKNIHLVTKENDIKFRGPLSYRHLRILGWLFLAISQVGILLGVAVSLKLININDTLLSVIKSSNSLMAPLFLIAAFAQVLVAKDGYRRLLRAYSLGAAGIYLLFLFLYLHFFIGLLRPISTSWSDARETVDTFIVLLNSGGTLSFNIFIDLVLCALVTFFINYKPTKYFKGKKIYLFRALVVLPILYEAGSITLKLLASNVQIFIPPLVIPLLTTKPPVAFFIFIVLALFVKIRERYYIKKGKTHADYKEFLNTNVNRFHFARTLAFTILGAVVLDVLLAGLVYMLKVNIFSEGADPEAFEEISAYAMQGTIKMGFGACIPMLLIIPIVMFFDYTKTYKKKTMDIIIPVAGIALIALVYLEGAFQVLRGTLGDLVNKISETGDDAEKQGLLVTTTRFIKNIFKGK